MSIPSQTMRSVSATLSPARAKAFEALRRVEQEGAYADLVLGRLSADDRMQSNDRALLNELVRGTIRWKKRLDWIVDQLWQGERKNLPRSARWSLWLGLYQLLFLDKVPEFAAVNESVEMAKLHAGRKWGSIVNGMLRSYLRAPGTIGYPNERKNPVLALAVIKSHPEWLIRRWVERFGPEQTALMCDANNAAPLVTIRHNPLKSTVSEFEDLLNEKKVAFVRSAIPGFYRISEINSAIRDELLAAGKMTIQDESAGLVGFLANPQASDTIFDVCAAPGGKCTHLAELSGDRAQVIAGDNNTSRVRLIRNAKQRLRLNSVQVVAADARNFPAHDADIVVLDAPCSGLGVLRKKPDLRWRRQEREISELSSLQRELLQRASTLVKTGGSLIYSTCTTEPEENEQVIEDFIKGNPRFTLISEFPDRIPRSIITAEGFIRTWPHVQQMDGSFAAKLARND